MPSTRGEINIYCANIVKHFGKIHMALGFQHPHKYIHGKGVSKDFTNLPITSVLSRLNHTKVWNCRLINNQSGWISAKFDPLLYVHVPRFWHHKTGGWNFDETHHFQAPRGDDKERPPKKRTYHIANPVISPEHQKMSGSRRYRQLETHPFFRLGIGGPYINDAKSSTSPLFVQRFFVAP